MSWASRDRIITKALLFTALSVVVGGARTAPPALAPSVVLITIDTLRADHVSSLHAQSPVTTPHLDALAADSALFLSASTTNPLTFPAHASMMTGTWPPAHGVRDFTGYRLSGDSVTLAETLRKSGYRTAAFVSAAVLDHRTGMAQGFDVYNDGFDTFLGSDTRVAERPGAETLRLARNWLEEASSSSFLWVHLFEPHDPYTPPEPYRSRYRESPYAGEVAYVDSLVGGFLDALRKRGLYDSSLIAVLSDHGEGLGDHGESKHGFFVYQSTMHVPWIVKFPGGRFAGRKISQNVSVVDLFPTVLHGAGVERRNWPPALQGKSRFQTLLGSRGKESAIYMESLTPRNQYGFSDLRAMVQGRFKLIEAPTPELYDLQSDPTEKANLFESRKALGQRLRESLSEFESRFEGAPASSDASEIDAELEERLRSIGYVGSPGLARRYQSRKGLADPKTMISIYELVQQGVEAAREKRWESAIGKLLSAAGRAPGSPSILNSLALAYRDAGRPKEALEWFGRYLKLVPDDSFVRLELAKYLLALRRPLQAKEQFEAILERDSRSFLALFNLGIHWARSSDFSQSVDFFRRALEVKDDPEASRLLGLALVNLGRLKEAESAYRRALELSPGDPAVHAALADLYARLGQPEKAAEHRRKVRN